MKKILFILLFLSCKLFAKENPDHFVQSKDGVYFITHSVKQESIFEIAKIYQVKPAVLARFNELTYSSPLQTNQIIDIPLTETNYYKLAGLNEENGFIKIFYRIEDNTDVEYLCDKFQVSIESFCQWNKAQQNTAYKTGQTVMIGWLIYQPNQVLTATTQNSPPQSITNSTETTRKVANGTSTKTTTNFRGNEPTLSNSFQKFWGNLKEKTKSKEPKSTKVSNNQTPPQVVVSKSSSTPPLKSTSVKNLEDTLKPISKQPNRTYSQQPTANHRPTFKEDTRDFFEKIKKKFRKKNTSNEVAMAKPIKNDPNRTTTKRNLFAKKSNEEEKPKLTLKEKWNRLVNGPEPQTTNKRNPTKNQPITLAPTKQVQSTANLPKQDNTTPQKKKTLKEKWDLLVNGKTPQPKKKPVSEEKIVKNDRVVDQKKTTDKSSIVNTQKNPTASNTVSSKSNTSNTHIATKPKKSFKESWNQLVNGKPVEKKANTEAPKPIAKNNVLQDKKNTLKQADNKQDKNSKTEIKSEKAIANTAKTKSEVTNKTKKNIDSKPFEKKKELNNNAQNVKNNSNHTLAAKEEKSIPPVEVITREEEKDLTIRSETKQLNLNKSETGKAAYFFAGPNGNKFYASTNLAKKGDIVKITNLTNGRNVMAEVVGGLSPLDERKGLLIKLSDNAKLPLGQKGSIFSVKINY